MTRPQRSQPTYRRLEPPRKTSTRQLNDFRLYGARSYNSRTII